MGINAKVLPHKKWWIPNTFFVWDISVDIKVNALCIYFFALKSICCPILRKNRHSIDWRAQSIVTLMWEGTSRQVSRYILQQIYGYKVLINIQKLWLLSTLSTRKLFRLKWTWPLQKPVLPSLNVNSMLHRLNWTRRFVINVFWAICL